MGAQRRTLQKVHGKTTHVYHPEEEEDLTCQGSIGSAFLYTLAIYFTSLEPCQKTSEQRAYFFSSKPFSTAFAESEVAVSASIVWLPRVCAWKL